MKILCEKEKLIKGLNSIQGVTNSKTTLPILQGILIQTNNNEVKLTTNDNELGIEYIFSCNVKEQGAIVVDSKMFSEIIRKLPDSEIKIELKNNNILEIECLDSLYKLSTMNPEEFPELPVIEIEKSIKISDVKLKSMIKKSIIAISLDETKPIFTGCLLEVDKNNIKLVSIDGFRLAYTNETINNNAQFKCVIPGKTLNEINKILLEEGIDVTIGIANNQVMFLIDNCKVISRLLEGEFLNYETVIPKTKDTRIKVKTQEIIKALERVSLVSFSIEEKSRKFPVKFAITVGKLTLTCDGKNGNESKEELYLETEGKDLNIGFNHKYLLDALKACDDEEIYIDYGSNIAPCLIKPIENESYLFMVLPVRLTE